MAKAKMDAWLDRRKHKPRKHQVVLVRYSKFTYGSPETYYAVSRFTGEKFVGEDDMQVVDFWMPIAPAPRRKFDWKLWEEVTGNKRTR